MEINSLAIYVQQNVNIFGFGSQIISLLHAFREETYFLNYPH